MINSSLALPRLHHNRLPAVVADDERLAAVWVIKRLIGIVAASFQQADSNSKVRLEFAHPRLDLVLIDRLPNVCRPVLVEFVWVFIEQHLVAVEPEICIALVADSSGVVLSVFLKYRQNLAFTGSPR